MYFLNRPRNRHFLVDTKWYVCSNKSCVRSFAGCADLNLAGLCWVACQWATQRSVEFTRHVLVTVRIAWNLGRGDTKKVPGTRYCTQWKTPQKWTVLNRTVPYHAVEKRHFMLNDVHGHQSMWAERGVVWFFTGGRSRFFLSWSVVVFTRSKSTPPSLHHE